MFFLSKTYGKKGVFVELPFFERNYQRALAVSSSSLCALHTVLRRSNGGEEVFLVVYFASPSSSLLNVRMHSAEV